MLNHSRDHVYCSYKIGGCIGVAQFLPCRYSDKRLLGIQESQVHVLDSRARTDENQSIAFADLGINYSISFFSQQDWSHILKTIVLVIFLVLKELCTYRITYVNMFFKQKYSFAPSPNHIDSTEQKLLNMILSPHLYVNCQHTSLCATNVTF